MSRRQGPHSWQERKKYSKEDAHAVKLGVVLALEPQSNNEKIGTQVETAATQPSNLILYTNMNKDKTTESVNEGRYERIRAADIKKHGYTELAGRNDPTRAAVVKANTLKIARDRRLAGIVPGSPNARPENRSDALIHSARKSAEKRAAGIPSPRIAPKNRDRTIADSFNHGLEEGRIKRKDVRFINSNKVSTHDQVSRSNRMGLTHNIVRRNDVRDAQHFSFGGQTGFGRGFIDDRKRVAGIPSPRIAPKNRDRKIITNSFNHGLDEKFRRALRFINRKNTNSKYASEYASEYAKDRAINRSLARGNILQTQGWSPGLGKAKREAQIHSPRTPPKNRDRTIADSFNHGLEEGQKRNHRVIQSISAPPEVVIRAVSAKVRHQEAQDNGVRNTRERLRRIRRNLTNSFNHGLEEAKRPTTRPIKQSKSILGAGARGAIRGMTTPKPAGTSRTKHVLGQAVRNIARHVMDKFL